MSTKAFDMDGDDAPCEHYGSRTGIVTNQPDKYDHNRALCSVTVCGKPSCRALAIAYVRHPTNEPGIYISDSSRKAMA